MVKKMWLGGAALGAALLAALGVASCATIAGLDGDFHRDGSGGTGAGGASTSASGGTTSSGGTGGSGGSTGCVLDVPPDPPAIADDGGDIEFVTALRTIDVDEADDKATRGLDLDGVCTCFQDAPPSCTPVADVACDGPGGIDNALGVIFNQVKQISFNLITSGQLSAAANQGIWTSLMRVRGYNGKADDAKVEVLSYRTQGVDAGMAVPTWDGNDAWPVDEASLTDPLDLDSAISKSSEAYVTGGVLVVRYPVNRIRIRGDVFSMTIDLVDAVFRANLEAVAGGAYRLTNGVTAGRWPSSNAFEGLASLRYGGSSKLCTDDDQYGAVKATFCGKVDLRADGAAGVCDMLSFGASFTAEPAKLGPIVPAEGPPPNPCAVDKDPSTDTCN